MISHIDHFVLTVGSLDATCAFYERVLGFIRIDTPGKPTALAFGRQKINLHEVGHTFEPKAAAATVGAGDFCLITERADRRRAEAPHVLRGDDRTRPGANASARRDR